MTRPSPEPGPDLAMPTTGQLRRELAALRDILETRLDGMDQAGKVLDQTVNRTPTVIQTAIANVREVYDERFRSVEKLGGERFASIALQFSERDVRTEQAATASASALAAALQAAKEAVFEQAQAAAKAAEKTELSFTKQIDQIGLQISTVAKGFDDRIGELKERIDRGEGAGSGSAATVADRRAEAGYAQAAQADRGTQQRATIGIVVAAFSAVIALAAVIVLIVAKG